MIECSKRDTCLNRDKLCFQCDSMGDVDIIHPCYKHAEFDRDTALSVLKEFSRVMRPSNDIFGGKTLVISRNDFEMIRKKYLDKKGDH